MAMTTENFSVLLLRPDYVTTDDDDTLFWTGPADDPAGAVFNARHYACLADTVHLDDGADYAVLLVLAGLHQDINPERN